MATPKTCRRCNKQAQMSRVSLIDAADLCITCKIKEQDVMDKQKLYVGTKIITAVPYNHRAFLNDIKCINDPSVADEEGYLVKYPDGYTSWSPKATFDDAYRELTKSEKTLLQGLLVYVDLP